MKQQKPTPAVPNTTMPIEPPSNTRYEDWIDKVQLMQKFNISARTVDYYIERGILRHTQLGGRKYFYLPHIIRLLEQNYR